MYHLWRNEAGGKVAGRKIKKDNAMEDYHIFTKGLEDKLLFRDKEDYRYGINSIPIVLQGTDCQMLAFCLMSNHVHFVLSGNLAGAITFINGYKHRLSLGLRRKYEEPEPLRGLSVAVKEIDSIDYLKTVIAYVIRNPLSAGLREMPYGYEWCSGKYYFCKVRHGKVERIGDMSENRVRKLLRTKKEPTPMLMDCMVDEEGMVLPESYLNIARVEEIYRTCNSFLYFISRKEDEKVEREMGQGIIDTENDTFVRKSVKEICLRLFRTADFSQLSYENKCFLADAARTSLGVSSSQLTRILGIRK